MFISRPPDARPSWASDRGRDPRGVAARPSPGRRNVHGFVRSTRVGHLADHPHDCRDPVGRGRRLPESGHKCASGRASRFGRAAGSLGGKSVDGSGDATIARSRPRTFGGMEQAHPIGPRGGAIGDRNLPRRDLDGRRQHARRLPAEGRRADAHRLRPHHPKRRAGRDDGRAHAAIGESRGARPRLQHRPGGAARGAGPGGDRRVGPERDSQRRTGPGPHRGRQGPPRPGGMGPRLHRIWSPGVHDGQRHRFRPPGPPRHVRPGLRSIVAVLDWPMAFDPNSMASYLLGGLTFPTAPSSWYVDTTFTSPADGAGNLILPFNGHVYNVLGVPSASGIFHLGLHPDFTLGSDYGEFVAVLVSDSTTPGVYDTVHVDLDDNHVFGNDKAATVASPEIWADTDGDGLADLSGGLIYFIGYGAHP